MCIAKMVVHYCKLQMILMSVLMIRVILTLYVQTLLGALFALVVEMDSDVVHNKCQGIDVVNIIPPFVQIYQL